MLGLVIVLGVLGVLGLIIVLLMRLGQHAPRATGRDSGPSSYLYVHSGGASGTSGSADENGPGDAWCSANADSSDGSSDGGGCDGGGGDGGGGGD